MIAKGISWAGTSLLIYEVYRLKLAYIVHRSRGGGTGGDVVVSWNPMTQYSGPKYVGNIWFTAEYIIEKKQKR